MNKQEIFPSPLRLHNNNGFDIARRMNKQHRKRIAKDEKILCARKEKRHFAFCTISMIFFLAAAYSQPRQMKSASLKENF